MQLANTQEQYGLVARSFHWLIAVFILALIPMGLYMGTLENSPFKFQVFAMHKSFGLLVLFLGIARIVWRFISPPPHHLSTHQRWETVLASAAHFWLYVCVIGMPLSGWLMSSAGEFPVPFFGIQLPHIIGKNEALGDLFYQVHEILAYTLLIILGLHIAGALKHHVIDKDATLQRMAGHSKWVVPVLIVIYAALSYGQSANMLLQDFLKEKTALVETADTAPAADTAAAADLPDTSALAEHGWAIVPGQSTLQFKATLYNAPFTGELKKFSGEIVFNPDDLSTAKADIRISMAEVETGDAERDTSIKSAEWFNVPSFPEAHFVSTKFEKGADGKYVAVGDLTIRDVTMPVALPFDLLIDTKKAHMTAHVELDRLDFKLGTGQWEDEGTLAHRVDVFVDLIAVQ